MNKKINKIVKFLFFYIILVVCYITVEHLFNRDVHLVELFVIPFIITFFLFLHLVRLEKISK
jgi:magnesium-transporting ATPase (P-type)